MKAIHDSKTTRSHLFLVEECGTEEEAKAFGDMWVAAIAALSTTLKVYVRREPTIEFAKSFEEGTEKWRVSCRFTIGPGPGQLIQKRREETEQPTGFVI